ncbi:RidA family protein [Nocardia sp. NPDC059240]|uniref:RidA family protein n=1 Tax=Nocardia sp. NPDC059240 TaxID=3346786 RepID=UPI0036D0BA48
MEMIAHDADSVPVAVGGYTNGLEVIGARRLLFVSGQIPEGRDGEVPDDAAGQCRLIWRNIVETLAHAGLTVANIVKVTTYLSDRSLAAINTAVRTEVLDGHQPALTVVLAGIFNPRWLLEIEVIAAEG